MIFVRILNLPLPAMYRRIPRERAWRPGNCGSVERALCQEIDQIDEMLEPGVRTICVDNPGYYWVQRNSWERVAWPELTDKKLERLADLAWKICHGDMPTPRGVARGSFPDPATDSGGAHIKLDVTRPPVIRDGIVKLALRLPFREELSLEALFEGWSTAGWNKPAAARPKLDDLKEGEDLGAKLKEAIAKREMILVDGPSIAERFEFIDILAKSIPEGRRIVVLDGDNGWSVRDDVLPENSVRLRYSGKSGGISIQDVARAAEALRPDHLIVPHAEDMERDEYLLYVGQVFSGQIVRKPHPFPGVIKVPGTSRGGRFYHQ